MDDLCKVFSYRFKQLISKEPNQTSVAEKLLTTQPNISMWKNGSRMPSAADLLRIAKLYDVSVDWLLGLDDDCKRGHIHMDTLTYEQLLLLMDLLLEKGILQQTPLPENDSLLHIPFFQLRTDAEPDQEENDEESEDLEGQSFDKKFYLEPKSAPVKDYDYLKIADQVLAFSLRRRDKLKEIDENAYIDSWKNKVNIYADVPLVDYRTNAKDLIDMRLKELLNTDADWANLIKEITGMTEEERDAVIARLNKKEA